MTKKSSTATGDNNRYELDLRNDEIAIRSKHRPHNLEEAFKKWAGTGPSLQQDGFASVEEYMKVLRGRYNPVPPAVLG